MTNKTESKRPTHLIWQVIGEADKGETVALLPEVKGVFRLSHQPRTDQPYTQPLHHPLRRWNVPPSEQYPRRGVNCALTNSERQSLPLEFRRRQSSAGMTAPWIAPN